MAWVVALVVTTAVAVVVTNGSVDRQRAHSEARAERVGNGATPLDFDGDGRSDLALFRPETATFWIELSEGGELVVPLGESTSRPTSGDFDGDGEADPVAVTPGIPNVWEIRYSGDGTQQQFGFGLDEDVLTPGDYDGDGRTDPAVFRPGDEPTWYIRQSSDGDLSGITFGIDGDIPAPGDYDGDGVTDVAVQRDGERWILRSSDGETVVYLFGRVGDRPVAADRDGDDLTDLAVLRVEAGDLVWYSRPTPEAETTSFVFGRSDDPPQQPFVGDFDGDGSTEPAVFEPSTATFFIHADDEPKTELWGLDGDRVLLPGGVW